MRPLDYIEEIHGENPDAAIIWLHGLGANGHDFQPIIKQLDLPANLSIHFVFPHAPVQPVTLNNGVSMNSWYDIYELNLDADEDEHGINTSMQALEALIESKFSHIQADRILLAGFSQGGALALHTLLHGSKPIGGVIALSTYLPLRDKAIDASKERVHKRRIYMAHGKFDEVLPQQVGDLAREILLALGANVSWHSYPMAHELCAPQIAHISQWIVEQLS